MGKFTIRITSSKDEKAEFQTFILTIGIVEKWIKAVKLIGLLVLAGFFYGTGYRIAGHISYVQDNARIEAIKERMRDREQYWSAVRLSTDDRKFLNEHLFGSWSFSRRLISLGECGEQGDFSNLAEKEIKGLWVTFEEDFVRIKGYDADTFSNVHDVYLFTEYGEILCQISVFTRYKVMWMKACRPLSYQGKAEQSGTEDKSGCRMGETDRPGIGARSGYRVGIS